MLQRFAFLCKIRSIEEKEGHETLMNYLYVESIAIAQGQAMDFFDWRMKTKFARMKAAYGVRHDEGVERVGNYVQDPREGESNGLAVQLRLVRKLYELSRRSALMNATDLLTWRRMRMTLLWSALILPESHGGTAS